MGVENGKQRVILTMPNKSYYYSGLRTLVQQSCEGIEHSTAVHVEEA